MKKESTVEKLKSALDGESSYYFIITFRLNDTGNPIDRIEGIKEVLEFIDDNIDKKGLEQFNLAGSGCEYMFWGIIRINYKTEDKVVAQKLIDTILNKKLIYSEFMYELIINPIKK